MNDAAPTLVHHQIAGKVLVLTPQVEQMRDTEICYSIRDGMTDYVKQVDHRRVVIDMQNVNFVSSIGILAFLNLRRAVPNDEERIIFCNLSSSLTSMFRICKLISENPNDPTPFDSVDTLESALSTA
ncbi:STAS domain-containing protein [Bremerella alba]|uniref:STAS domain-containing protein n=1 Tax=Bremerella alba TaxID=980252 RepID=A0A7V8V9J5_9BACT|nr:STAS domain-containing protein [Bremerella alba]MBA2117423.1 hypothetical protein [Bremerella alba]